jgi:hypothetical protein
LLITSFQVSRHFYVIAGDVYTRETATANANQASDPSARNQEFRVQTFCFGAKRACDRANDPDWWLEVEADAAIPSGQCTTSALGSDSNALHQLVIYLTIKIQPVKDAWLLPALIKIKSSPISFPAPGSSQPKGAARCHCKSKYSARAQGSSSNGSSAD